MKRAAATHFILTHFAVFSSSLLTQFPLRFTLDRNAANIVSGLDLPRRVAAECFRLCLFAVRVETNMQQLK